jgi:hypothetical protein
MAARRNADGAGKAQAHPAPSSRSTSPLEAMIAGLANLDADQLRLQWRNGRRTLLLTIAVDEYAGDRQMTET